MTLTVTAHEIEQTRKLTTRLALVLEYDGANYSGFQWQTNVSSIQGTLENAVEKLTGEKVRVLGSAGPIPAFMPAGRWLVLIQVLHLQRRHL